MCLVAFTQHYVYEILLCSRKEVKEEEFIFIVAVLNLYHFCVSSLLLVAFWVVSNFGVLQIVFLLTFFCLSFSEILFHVILKNYVLLYLHGESTL